MFINYIDKVKYLKWFLPDGENFAVRSQQPESEWWQNISWLVSAQTAFTNVIIWYSVHRCFIPSKMSAWHILFLNWFESILISPSILRNFNKNDVGVNIAKMVKITMETYWITIQRWCKFRIFLLNKRIEWEPAKDRKKMVSFFQIHNLT